MFGTAAGSLASFWARLAMSIAMGTGIGIGLGQDATE